MYSNAFSREPDEAQLLALIGAYGFATLVSNESGRPVASHLPLIAAHDPAGRLVLRGHQARANPQWRSFSAPGEVLAIFHGPHAYVSPSCYTAPGASVPTWNYAVVHAYGTPRLIQEPAQVLQLLAELTDKYEADQPNPWRVQDAEGVSGLLEHIVAFELVVTRLEGSFKLGQNRSARDYRGIISALERGNVPDGQRLIELMRAREPR